MYDRNALIELIREKALKTGKFILASGREASFYLDCRQVTLDGRGANLVAEGILDLMGQQLPDAVGGMAIGADPITAATVTVAAQRGLALQGFIVRKEAKTHGRGLGVEGPVHVGQTAIVVEDVVTTGGSALKAIERVEAFGLTVREVIAVVDRLEGGRQTLEEKGYALRTLLTIRDFGIEPDA